MALFISCAFLSFLCCLNGAFANGAKDYHDVDVNGLLPGKNCSGPATPKGSALGAQMIPVTYRYGPCSPISKGKKVPDYEQILLEDMKRVDSMTARMSSLYPAAESGRTPASAVGAGNYVVTIGFGTPKSDYSLILDTGSDITWIYCQPCSDCHHPFNPSLSSSYSIGSCMSYPENSRSIHYLDGSFSNVLFGCDTLTIDHSEVINKFQFGCGQNSSNDFDPADGMLGLGQGKLSLVSQAATKFGEAFSYCLPTSGHTKGYLLFGKKSKASSLKFTPLVKKPDNSYYFLDLNGISIAGQKLQISPSVFSYSGTIIDSGTTITRLPAPVYSALRSAFVKSMSKYPPAQPLPPLLDTCYNLNGYEKVKLPKIILHFGGGTDVSLDPSGTVWARSKNQVCLAFAAKKREDDWNIIGNNQQKALHVLYDIEGGRIGFGSDGCGN